MFGTIKHQELEDGDNHVAVAWSQDAAPTGLTAADDGKLWWDTDSADNDLYLCTDGSTNEFTKVGRVQNLIKAGTIESPTDSENLTLFFTNTAITISQVTSVLRGSSTPSVTFQLMHGTSRASGTQIVEVTETSTTNGTQTTSFDDATIPANSYIWLTTDAKSGTVNELHVSIEYTED